MTRSQFTVRAALAATLTAVAVFAQAPPIDRPLPPPPPPAEQDKLPDLPPESDKPAWPGLSPESARRLRESAKRYAEYAVRFTATETARTATYDGDEADRETVRRYGYLLERIVGEEAGIREYRQNLRKDGSLGRGETRDEEPFPPAYAWVFLFSTFHQPYFAYRDLGERFDGFDWVREIEFRGALPFTDGLDIRQWEGRALVDATTYAPIEIRAEPSRQNERIKLLFERWQQSFNLVGLRLAPRPFGYRCFVALRLRRDRLSFPTELRYDTFRAVGIKQTIPWKSSIRSYDGYRFFRTDSAATLVEPPGK
jgi:hypothetical protein